VTTIRGWIAVEDVMASLSEDRRKAIEARGVELLRQVERRQEQRVEADSSASLRNDKQR